MKIVILDEPADNRYLRLQANGYRLTKRRSEALSHGAHEIEVWIKYDGCKQEEEVDFADLPEKEER